MQGRIQDFWKVGSYVCVCVCGGGGGVHSADFISFFLNIPWKRNSLVSLRPNYFIFIGYLKTKRGRGLCEWSWTPCGSITVLTNWALTWDNDTFIFLKLYSTQSFGLSECNKVKLCMGSWAMSEPAFETIPNVWLWFNLFTWHDMRHIIRKHVFMQ